MAKFLGVLNCKLDSKDRFLLPKKLLAGYGLSDINAEEMPEFHMRFSINSTCYEVYLPKAFRKLEKRYMKKMNRLDVIGADAEFEFYSHVHTVTVDAQKRFMLPKKVRAHYPSKELVLIGLRDHFQIWDTEAFERKQEESRQRNLIQAVRETRSLSSDSL